MKKITFVLSLFALSLSMTTSAQQEIKGTKPLSVDTATSMQRMPSIASRSTHTKPTVKNGEVQDGRASRNKIVIGKGTDSRDALAGFQNTETRVPGSPTSTVFETVAVNSTPTDPSGAVGKNHYFAVFNTGFRIFEKDGTPLTGELGILSVFPENDQCCDLTISYDNAADRWIMTVLSFTNGVQIAVSEGSDPVTTDWFIYNITTINDYQKLSIWSDGYYMTDNTNAADNRVYALDRDAMLAGDADAQIITFPLPGISTNGFFSPQAFNVTNAELPAPGSTPIVYMQDDAWTGVDNDHIKLWEVDVDWVTPENSVISSEAQEIALTPFIGVFDGGGFSNLQQPNGGSSVDALQATIMNQAQFRKFDDHNSAVFDFVVDTDETTDKLAGIRWVELRQTEDGGAWSLYQEGTYTSPEGKHAWHGSMAMDSMGNIGMGYTAMGGDNETTLSSFFTGRCPNDPLGTMTRDETLIASGAGNIPSTRYGDYGKIDVDPADDTQFYFINEYVGESGRANVVGVFQIAPVDPIDVGVLSVDSPEDGLLGTNEVVTVTVHNFGSDIQSNFPVSYSVDGVMIATETFTGSLDVCESAQFTFTQGTDLSTEGTTYEIIGYTEQIADALASNDPSSRMVNSLFASDLGVSEIVAPVTGENLGNEAVVVTIENFGGADQANFDVSYTFEGNTVTETVTETVPALSSITYTFTEALNLSEFAIYTITAATSLEADAITDNDEATTTIENLQCNTSTNNTEEALGPDAGAVVASIITLSQNYDIQDLNVTINLTHTYDGDLDIVLISPDGTEVELSTGNGVGGDNYTNTNFDDDAETLITDGTAPFTGSFQPEGSLADFIGVVAQGDWTLRITDTANIDGGTFLGWSLTICGPEEALSIEEELLPSTEFLVINRGDNQFDVSLNTTEINERLNFQVFSMTGQKLIDYRLDHNGTGYQYDLDMSYAATGVYILRLGNTEKSKIQRIIVK